MIHVCVKAYQLKVYMYMSCRWEGVDVGNPLVMYDLGVQLYLYIQFDLSCIP